MDGWIRGNEVRAERVIEALLSKEMDSRKTMKALWDGRPILYLSATAWHTLSVHEGQMIACRC